MSTSKEILTPVQPSANPTNTDLSRQSGATPTIEKTPRPPETLEKVADSAIAKKALFFRLDEDGAEEEAESQGHEQLDVQTGRPPYDAFFTFLPEVNKATVFKTDKKTFLIDPAVVKDIQTAAPNLVRKVVLYTYLTHEGRVGVWPVSRDSDDSFSKSARKSFQRWKAEGQGWISIQRTSDGSSYQLKKRPSQNTEWPIIDGTSGEAATYILNAFAERTIDSINHEAVARFFQEGD